MDYKEKYNGALKRARIGLHDCNLLDCDNMTRKAVITTIYHLFPELAEDEDERIRKGIIRNLQYLMDRSEGFVKEDLQERIAWLEKQGESTITNIEIPFWANDSELQEVSYNIPEGFYAEIKDDRVVIKKVEPKFKVGDWVIKNGVVAKILDKQKYGFVGLDIDGKDFFCNYGHTDSMRLWTINDAKDGDVLVNSKGNPFIFTGKFTTNYHNPIAYCGIGNGDKFIVCALNWRFHWAEKKEVSPATKEQRDLLFLKMEQAGYEWDAEKKELEKMEVASKESKDEKIKQEILELVSIAGNGNQFEEIKDWLEKQGKKLDPDKVIEWIDEHIPTKFEEMQNYVNQFKKDFGI